MPTESIRSNGPLGPPPWTGRLSRRVGWSGRASNERHALIRMEMRIMRVAVLMAASPCPWPAPSSPRCPRPWSPRRSPPTGSSGPTSPPRASPRPEALARLGEMGFRTVVNLRTEKEGAAEERAVVEAQGLRYVWVPVTADSFSLADVEAVAEGRRRPLVRPRAAPLRVLEPRGGGLGRDPVAAGEDPRRGPGGRPGGRAAQPADGGGRPAGARGPGAARPRLP